MKPMAEYKRFMWLRIAIRRWLRARNERQLKVVMGWQSYWDRVDSLKQGRF